ncbi:MAG: UDP-glucuronic acid decarboxylase family protein [bacterium]
MKKKVLITGGAGFIGSHLCKKLLEYGNDVICVDNFITGRKDNIWRIMSHPRFELIRHDITLPLNIEVDQIYNLACPASPPQYQYNPIKTIKCSTIGMINMLGLAKRVKARILQASTSEVYGDPKEHPQKEEYWGNVNPIGLRSCYDEGKRVAECLCFDYQRQNHVDAKVVRIFNTYGPSMDPNDGRVVSNFIVRALRNDPLEIYGDGSQTRSFQYIDDLINGLVAMMGQENFTGPVNLGNPNEFTIKELAGMVLEMIPKSQSRIVYKEIPQDDPQKRKPDISLAKEKLNWEPHIKIRDGLFKTIKYFRESI